MERVPFGEAIGDEQLLGTAWKGLTQLQQVCLKVFYGLPLSSKKNPLTGFSELDGWAILQESCTWDELGYVTEVTPIPYTPMEYREFWGCIGRRAGKTSHVMCFSIVYEALLGGHENYIKPNQTCIIYLIAHSLGLAQKNMPFVREIINSSPLLANEIKNDTATGGIELKNGITILPSPPNLKAQRGIAVPVVSIDEVAFFYSDPEAANPDYEIVRAVTYSQMQFPNRKLIGISSPWSKEGLLYKNHRAGTQGKRLKPENRRPFRLTMVAFGTTASFGSLDKLLGKDLARETLQDEKEKDPDAFSRESLCVFPDSVSGFFNRALLDMALAKGAGVGRRDPILKGPIRPSYVAAMDPAFRRDSFAFAVAHKDTDNNIVIDLLKRWTPIKGQKLNPTLILSEIAGICRTYGILTLYSDQYQLESIQHLMLDLGMNVEPVDFTARSKAKIYGNLLALVNQQKLVLLDPDKTPEAKSTANELIQLERRNMPGGGIQISAPQGKHDDMATVVALASFKAIWMHSVILQVEAQKEPSDFDRCMSTIRRGHAQDGEW
jgi:hypothetical protein